MASLTENKPLLYSLLTSGVAILCLASGLMPDVANHFELVELDAEVTSLSCFHKFSEIGQTMANRTDLHLILKLVCVCDSGVIARLLAR